MAFVRPDCTERPTERRTVALSVWTEGTKERAPMRAVAVGRRCESTFLHFSVREGVSERASGHERVH